MADGKERVGKDRDGIVRDKDGIMRLTDSALAYHSPPRRSAGLGLGWNDLSKDVLEKEREGRDKVGMGMGMGMMGGMGMKRNLEDDDNSSKAEKKKRHHHHHQHPQSVLLFPPSPLDPETDRLDLVISITTITIMTSSLLQSVSRHQRSLRRHAPDPLFTHTTTTTHTHIPIFIIITTRPCLLPNRVHQLISPCPKLQQHFSLIRLRCLHRLSPSPGIIWVQQFTFLLPHQKKGIL
jgi:hypothetical protein